jgi:DNA-binding LacI/PurR family transcriptional regulator
MPLKLLDGPIRPDAIFCINDPVAILVIQTLKTLNVSIPDEVSVVGFTNEPSSQLIQPSLTTIAQPSHLMGQLATELLLEQIEHKDDFVPVKKVVATKLIIRNSTRKITVL